MDREYYNHNDDRLYVLHFSGNSFENGLGRKIAERNLDRNISVSNKISVISVMNKEYLDKSLMNIQLENNGIKLYNSQFALEETSWNNVNKIVYILDILDSIDTEYALILDGRDTVLVNDLDDEFIKKFKQFNKGIVFNSTTVPFPKVVIEDIDDLLEINAISKYLNAGVCFGKVEALKEFYNYCYSIKDQFEDNFSEQLVVRHAFKNNKDLVTVDYDCKLFRNCHLFDSNIIRIDDKKYKILF